MRFKGTWILLALCLALGCFIYFYEIRGGAEREKSREAASSFWTLESGDIRRIELVGPEERIVAARGDDGGWTIQAPRPLEADDETLDQMAEKAAQVRFESVLEETAYAQFGLDPERFRLKIEAADGQGHELLFGDRNPAGTRVYARTPGTGSVYLVSTALPETFDRKLEDLRDHSVLRFGPSEVRTLEIRNPRGTIRLARDADDRWWIERDGRVAADSPAVRGILNELSYGRIAAFFDEDPGTYANAGLDAPGFDVRLTYGEDKALKRLRIGPRQADLRRAGAAKASALAAMPEASTRYLAKDDSRAELFFVEQSLVDKLGTTEADLRDRALAAFQRWNVDAIGLENTHGSLTFVKEGGEWFFGDDRKKADFDAVSGILDALESKVVDWIDKPAGTGAYGLDAPRVRVTLRQGETVVADCRMGAKADGGVYARVQGDPSVKIADAASYDKLDRNRQDYAATEAADALGPDGAKE